MLELTHENPGRHTRLIRQLVEPGRRRTNLEQFFADRKRHEPLSSKIVCLALIPSGWELRSAGKFIDVNVASRVERYMGGFVSEREPEMVVR